MAVELLIKNKDRSSWAIYLFFCHYIVKLSPFLNETWDILSFYIFSSPAC